MATKTKPKNSGKPAKQFKYTAATADRHELYQLSVQNVEAEIDFVDATYLALRGRHANRLREDFAGTANSACEWVRRRETCSAVAVDLDGPTLEWGRRHNLAALDESQQRRIELLEADVRDPGQAGQKPDIVLAMNFSYWILTTRDSLRDYFRSVLDALPDDGVFFLDFYGGSEAMTEVQEKRKISRHLTYIWDQHRFDPISGLMECRIHFKFPDGSQIRDAFTYNWRLWSLPEIRELLTEAGFADVGVYWEGTDPDDDEAGNGEFRPVLEGDADPAFICYLVAQKQKLGEIEPLERPE
ncbi:MAG: class I SAM-dependent methyltransferase [Planctomycetota bacterium]